MVVVCNVLELFKKTSEFSLISINFNVNCIHPMQAISIFVERKYHIAGGCALYLTK